MAIQNAVSNQFLTTTSTPAFVNVINGFTSTATAAGTTVLTATSTGIQEFTGTTTQTVTLPVVSTLPRTGVQYYIVNNSSGVVTVQSSGANTIQAMDANTSLLLTCILATGTTAASWNATYFADSGLAGAVLLNPTGNQTINGAFNLIMASGSVVAPTMLPGNLSLSANTLSSTNTNGDISLIPNGTGTTSVGSSTLFTGTGSGFFTLEVAKSGAQAFLSVGSFKNNASPSVLGMYKSRSTSVGSHVTVNSGDALGATQYNADDGTNYVTAAQIDAVVASSPSTGIVPTDMRFYTSNSSGVLTNGMTLNSSQSLTVAGQVIAPSFSPNTTSGIIGTTTNDNAAAGSVGEEVESIIPDASIVTLTTATPANLTSISLTAGDWDVWGNCTFTGDATTNVTQFFGGSNTVSATVPAAELRSQISFPAAGVVIFATGRYGFTVPQKRFSLPSTTTIYLVVRADFTIGACQVTGALYARRRR
jgi:hypothetical protein